MSFVTSFISQYGMIVVYAALTAIAGFIGTQLKTAIIKRDEDETKLKVAQICVKAVEQLYQDLKGEDKLCKAKENIAAMLANKGIEISEIEMDMLIESCVAEFNLKFLAEAKAELKEKEAV